MMTTLRNNIGRDALFKIRGQKQILQGNVMDLVAGTDQPKRIRVQFGDPALKGNVVQPSEYVFMGWADEDDP